MNTSSQQKYKYDIAISFAGEDRKIASRLANMLKDRNIKTFFDEFEVAKLWGKNLYDYVSEIYLNDARFCIILISKHYVQKAWTNHERKVAQARAFRENSEYILPLRIDDAELPGMTETIVHLDLRNTSIDKVVDIVIEKLRNNSINSAKNFIINETQKIDSLVSRIRFEQNEKIKHLYGHIRLFDLNKPVPLDLLYVDVNILDEPSHFHRLEIPDLVKDFIDDRSDSTAARSFDRLGLRPPTDRVQGLTAISNYPKIMILGKPGSGKTTFLQYITIQCNEGTLAKSKIPIFVRLRDCIDMRRKYGNLIW